MFSAVGDTHFKSTIYRLGLNSSGKPEMVELTDPAGPEASPVSAVAFGADVAATDLITGRLDGSVYCGPSKLIAERPRRYVRLRLGA